MANSRRRGTRGLRKRCPQCGKTRRFHGDGEEGRSARALRWRKVGERWVCIRCVAGVEINNGPAFAAWATTMLKKDARR